MNNIVNFFMIMYWCLLEIPQWLKARSSYSTEHKSYLTSEIESGLNLFLIWY